MIHRLIQKVAPWAAAITCAGFIVDLFLKSGADVAWLREWWSVFVWLMMATAFTVVWRRRVNAERVRDIDAANVKMIASQSEVIKTLTEQQQVQSQAISALIAQVQNLTKAAKRGQP